MSATQIFATIYYVDAARPDNTGAGTSWATAKKDIQDAINLATTGDEVWVKAGTYKPTEDPFGSSSPTDPRDITFYVKDGVKLYGGFAGTEMALSERLITTNVTTLSGDIGTSGDDTDNTYHVVLASADMSTGMGVTIDGFTVSGGNADNPDSNFRSISVNGNSISTYLGGGIYTVYGTNTFTNNTISENLTEYDGGGIYTNSGINTFSNNTFLGNFAGEGGGAIRADGATNTFTNNTFSENSSFSGGAISTTGGINTYTNNTFSGNVATNSGGGLLIKDGTNTFTNNTFSGNSAITSGGALLIIDGTNTFTNNTFLGNSAINSGGGGISSYAGTNTIKNCIFWGNQQGGSSTVAGVDISGAIATVTYCLTQKNSNYSTGTGIINNQDPLFVNASDIDGADNIHRTADDGLRLKPCSPAINTGNNTGVAATDITGATRTQQTTVDMGAYENKDLTGYTLSPSILTANAECTDGAGITHYYNTTNEALLLSLNKNGNNIGTIGDGTFALTAGGS
jgi:parallel beta-helix repeat protein